MTWTTYEDLEGRWLGDSLTAIASQPQIETLIADAEDIILREFPTIQQRIDDDELPIVRVIRVTYNMIARVLRNPSGMRSLTRGAGPFQESATYGGEEPGGLYLTEQDKRELQETTQGTDAFAIDMTPIGYSAYGVEQGCWAPFS